MNDLSFPKVSILTPIKDAAELAKGYFSLLEQLTYPSEYLSLCLLESDSKDQSYECFSQCLKVHKSRFRNSALFQHHFGYRIPDGIPRWTPEIQLQRRSILAMSRNHLLFRGLGDADWALWLDADVISYPIDLIEQLIFWDKDIVRKRSTEPLYSSPGNFVYAVRSCPTPTRLPPASSNPTAPGAPATAANTSRRFSPLLKRAA